MIDQDRLERLYAQCGGVFRTTVLIQKRIKELNRGARRLIDGEFKSPIELVVSEIEAGKVELIEDSDENREVIRKEIEKMTPANAAPQAEVPAFETSEDELERRIMSALQKERNG